MTVRMLGILNIPILGILNIPILGILNIPMLGILKLARRNRTREIEARQIAMIVRRGTPPGQAGHCRKPGGAGSDSANVV